jgi:hypothetical protein
MRTGADRGNRAGASAGNVTGAAPRVSSVDYPKRLLPAGAIEVLQDRDLPPQKDAKTQAAVEAYFGGPAIAYATQLTALAQYLTDLMPQIQSKVDKDSADLINFLSRLRVWRWCNEVYALAANDFDTADQRARVAKLVADICAVLTDPKDIAIAKGLAAHYAAAKDAQTAVLKLQVACVCTLPIYEFRAGTNTTYTQWVGAIALNPKVRGDKDVWPIPPCAAPWLTTPSSVNPIFKGNLPGLADYIPFDAYGKAEGSLQGIAVNSLPLDKRYPNVDKNILKSIIDDQAARLGQTPTLAAEGMKDWVSRAVVQDPEFQPENGWAFNTAYVLMTTLTFGLNNIGKDPKFSGNVASALPKAIAAVTKIQDAYRKSKPVVDAQGNVIKTLSIIAGTVAAVCNGVPPVPVSREYIPQAGLILPVANWNKWREEVNDLPAKGMTNLIKGFGWWKQYPDIVQTIIKSLEAHRLAGRAGEVDPKYLLLDKWTPGSPSPWPAVPAVGFREADVAAAADKFTAQAKAAMVELTPTQVEWVTQRAAVKAALTLSMMLTELGKKSKGATDEMQATLSYFAEVLYGRGMPDAPEGLKGKELLDWYDVQIAGFAKNPTPESLMGQLLAKLQSWEKTKDPQTKLEIDQLASKVARVSSRRGARRGMVVDNSTAPGGTLNLIEKSQNRLNSTNPGTVKLPDGTKAEVGVTTVESNKASATVQENKDIKTKTDTSLSYTHGSGKGLLAINELIPGSLPPEMKEQIDTNQKKTEEVVDPTVTPQSKGGSGWLLLGLAAAAFAATRKD